jgi:hypothetical protein
LFRTLAERAPRSCVIRLLTAASVYVGNATGYHCSAALEQYRKELIHAFGTPQERISLRLFLTIVAVAALTEARMSSLPGAASETPEPSSGVFALYPRLLLTTVPVEKERAACVTLSGTRGSSI